MQLSDYEKAGLIYGSNFNPQDGCSFDYSHCWMISIGDNVTLAPNVTILAHDTSTKTFLGYTRIAPVKIGSNVFIGASTVILPGVSIGDNVIVGANSTVTKSLEPDSVYVGSPAKRLCSLTDYLEKERDKMQYNENVFDESYTMRNGITNKMKRDQYERCSRCGEGFVE